MRRILTKKSQRAMARSGTAICPICFERHLLVLHHIFGREVTGWNKPWNEVLLCSNCHFDVHHGNGTAHMFEEDDTVFYFSTHQYPHYPGTGKDTERGKGKGDGFTYNVTLHFGSGDKDYYYAYRDILPRLIKNFRPDIILVSAGYDIHVNDPLSGINVTNEGMRSIVRGILLRRTTTYLPSLPYVFALEGGYDLQALGESVLNTLKELLED